jgi:hypothetical protein
MDYQVLANEITNNPKSIQDLDWDQSDKRIMDTLNTQGVSGETIARELVNTADIITAIYSDAGEFMALSQIDLLRLNLLSPVGNVDPAAIQDVIKEIFPQETFPIIRAALIALSLRPASRAEKIPNLGATSITLIAMNKARRIHNG